MPPHTLSIILIFHIHIIYMNKEKNPFIQYLLFREGQPVQTHEKEYTMLTTIITATSIITGITGTTLGIKAAVTDRRQDKTLNTLNESLKKFDDRMKTIESDCHAMAPAVQQLLAIMQSAPQPAQVAQAAPTQPQPAQVAAAPTQPQPVVQVVAAPQPAAAPAAQQA